MSHVNIWGSYPNRKENKYKGCNAGFAGLGEAGGTSVALVQSELGEGMRREMRPEVHWGKAFTLNKTES